MTNEKKISITKSQSQSDKFKAMAKELKADGDEPEFDRLIKKVLKDPAKSS